MRTLLFIVVIVLLLSLAGWLVFDFSGNSASVEVRTDKIRQDTEDVVDKSKELLHQAEQEINH